MIASNSLFAMSKVYINSSCIDHKMYINFDFVFALLMQWKNFDFSTQSQVKEFWPFVVKNKKKKLLMMS